MEDLKSKPDSYWKERLTPEQYRVLRERGTEAPGSGEYASSFEDGMYHCAACGQELFASDTKFESTLPGLQGWPAFYAEAAGGRVELRDDNSFGMHRTEITCSRCGAHLGHLFEGDPAVSDKGGKHYCVNSCALKLEKAWVDVADYILSKPGAVEDYPFGSGTSVFKVGGKLFALAPATDKPVSLNLKCDPVRAQVLRQDYPEITPGYHMNKQHWNTLDLTGNLSEELVRELVDHSYDLVVAGLSKPVRSTLL